jgi:hypothetical protein
MSMTTSAHFTGETAPCGRTVDGDHVRDEDEDGFLLDRMKYACGCQVTRTTYHDGGVSLRIVDHHGKVRTDEHSSMHEA